MAVAGGARAAATSGFDSVGGGGMFGAVAGGCGEVDELGSLTVATGLIGDCWLVEGPTGGVGCGGGPCC